PIKRPLPINTMGLSNSPGPLRKPFNKPTLTTPSVWLRAPWVSRVSPTATERSRTNDQNDACSGCTMVEKRHRALVEQCSQRGLVACSIDRWLLLLACMVFLEKADAAACVVRLN